MAKISQQCKYITIMILLISKKIFDMIFDMQNFIYNIHVHVITVA